jgi:hypothetical protein
VFRRGQIDAEAEVSRLLCVARAAGFLREGADWVAEEVRQLAGLGFAGRLCWDLPPEVITMDDLIFEADKYRDRGTPRTNSDSCIWRPDERAGCITRAQWDGPSRPPGIRLAVFRARADDPEQESTADPVLFALGAPYEEQLQTAQRYMEQFEKAYADFTLEPLTHKGVCSLLLADRVLGVPAEERILSRGFLRVQYGWWQLYGNADMPRCGSITLSNDWFIMNESAGHPYPNDGIGLSIGIRTQNSCP